LCLFGHDWEYIDSRTGDQLAYNIIDEIEGYNKASYVISNLIKEIYNNRQLNCYYDQKVCIRCGRKIDEINLFKQKLKNKYLNFKKTEEKRRKNSLNNSIEIEKERIERRKKAELLWNK